MESSTVANHVVALVKGVTTSQTIDMAVVLQVSPPCFLPLLAPLPTSLFVIPSVSTCTHCMLAVALWAASHAAVR